jgi:hypothetical protein
MRSELLETPANDGWFLRVEFLWHVDRYRHVISAVDSTGLATPLLESVEGSLADDWPPSPPLQSLHLETRPDGSRVALLVGMAGKSHWSASIGAGASAIGLVFDLACRAAIASVQIGSRYRLASGVQLNEIDANTCRLQQGDSAVSITGSSDGATLTELHLMEGASIAIRPRERNTAGQSTRRWLYGVDLGSAELRNVYKVLSTDFTR